MQKNLFILLIAIVLTSCGSSRKTSSSNAILASSDIPQLTNGVAFVITEKSTDAEYGSSKKPIKVGGVADSEGPLNERRFLNALAGPNGEEITYDRQGSCCPFDTPNSSFGGMLDVYIITWKGQDKPMKLYINMYDKGALKIPVGFSAK
jgi:hypothetical protein